jgi:hypothetical protein
MCKRTTKDPLVRTFLDTYHLNLIPWPRSGIECGDLFRRSANGKISSEFALRTVVTPALDEPELDRGQRLGNLAGTVSEAHDVTVGVNLLSGFLAAIGAPGVLTDLGVEYQRTKTSSLAFEFRDATLDSIDPGELGLRLIDHQLRPDHPLVLTDSTYFVVCGVARSSSLTVHRSAQARTATNVNLEALDVAGAHTGLKIDRESDIEVTFRGAQAVVFGVELYELAADASGALRMLTPDGPLYSRGAAPPELRAAFIGDDGDAFIALEPETSVAGGSQAHGA